jgi:hypothetical protein
MAPKGKGKLKEKVTEPPSFDTFVVPLSYTMQTIDDVKREKRAITPPYLPTPPPSGIWSAGHGSFKFSPSQPSPIIVTSNRALGFHHMVFPFSCHSIVATKISS